MVSRITAALAARYKAIQEKEKGFTLIELLVVVIIIGVLAAIAIPIYIGVQNSAKDSAVKSDLTNAKIAVVAYYTEKNAMPSLTTNEADLKKYGMTRSDNTSEMALSGAAETFCIQAKRTDVTGDSPAGYFKISASGGVLPGVC